MVQVAVVGRMPAICRGWVSILRTARIPAEEPENLADWLEQGADRAVLVVARPNEGLSALADLPDDSADFPVVLLLPDPSEEVVVEILSEGVAAIGRWDTPVEEVRVMLEGAVCQRASVPVSLAKRLASSSSTAHRLALTGEETTLLEGLVQGVTIHELANRISYSERETSRRLKSLYQRLGVDSRLKAVAWALRGSHLGV